MSASSMNTAHPQKPQHNHQVLLSPHQDYIHSIAFDHYGRRLATCSGDRTVQIWDLNEQGEWTSSIAGGGGGNTNGWKAHSGAVTGISWAHPEFGQLIATCGSDGKCAVWEERGESAGDGGMTSNTTRWADRVRLADARKALSCVKFAPRHLRLQLATASADGVVRIYEAVDVTNLSQWLLKNTIRVVGGMIAGTVVGSGNKKRSSDNNGGGAVEESSVLSPSSLAELGVTCLDWGTGRFEPPALVVGSSSGDVGVYQYSDASRNWDLLLRLEGHSHQCRASDTGGGENDRDAQAGVVSSGRGGVLDVSWSPNVGRSFHLIASCGRDGTLRVHRLKRRLLMGGQTNDNDDGDGSDAVTTGRTLELESSQVLETGGAEIWRCAWNITGTVLASSGDGGVVQLWKSDFAGNWECVSELHRDDNGIGDSINADAV